MAYLNRDMPSCRKCGQSHFNFKPCPPRQAPVLVLRRDDVHAPEGFHYSKGWGNVQRVPTQWTHEPVVRHGQLIEPQEAA